MPVRRECKAHQRDSHAKAVPGGRLGTTDDSLSDFLSASAASAAAAGKDHDLASARGAVLNMREKVKAADSSREAAPLVYLGLRAAGNMVRLDVTCPVPVRPST